MHNTHQQQRSSYTTAKYTWDVPIQIFKMDNKCVCFPFTRQFSSFRTYLTWKASQLYWIHSNLLNENMKSHCTSNIISLWMKWKTPFVLPLIFLTHFTDTSFCFVGIPNVFKVTGYVNKVKLTSKARCFRCTWCVVLCSCILTLATAFPSGCISPEHVCNSRIN